MIAVGRARIIREVNPQVAQPTPVSGNQNAKEGQEVKVVEHERHGSSYSGMSDWMTITMRQYEMANVGLELYNQFVRSTTAITELWWKSFQIQ
jgi:hypothetical protein